MMYLHLTLLSLLILLSFISLVKIFSGKIIFKTNAEYASHNLIIEKSGFYSLWINGKLFSKPALEKYNAQIINENENFLFDMPSFFRPATNNGSTGNILIECYYLEKGTYIFKIGNGIQNSLTYSDKIIRKFISSKELDDFEYQIKKTYPELLFPICAVVIIFSILEMVEILS